MRLGDRRSARWAALVSVLLWAISLTLPAIWGPEQTDYMGYEVAIIGFLGLLVFNVAWFANLLLAPCLLLMVLGRPKEWLALAAVALALTTFIPFDVFGPDEGTAGPAQLGVGAFVWLAAFAPPLVISIARWKATGPVE